MKVRRCIKQDSSLCIISLAFKKEMHASSVSLSHSQNGSLATWSLNKSKLRFCFSTASVILLKFYFHMYSNLELLLNKDNYLFGFFLNPSKLCISLRLLSSEFHKLIDHGLHDLRNISVLFIGTVKSFRFLHG